MSESSHAKNAKALLSDSVYNTLKNTAVVILPAIGALYFTLAQIWHLPRAEEVVGSIAALNVFIGVLVSASTRSYNRIGVKYSGELLAAPSEDGESMDLQLRVDSHDQAFAIGDMDEATFKIVQE